MPKTKELASRFGFHGVPFTCEIRSQERYVNDIYETPIEHLYRALDKRMCAALIAPAGTGKTAVLRALIERLPEARYRVHYVKVTDLSKRDMCREIAAAAGIEPAGTYPALVKRLQDHFSACLTIDGLRPVLLVDEAHDIRPDVLGIMRILTNFDMDSRLVVSIVLAGQPPLGKLLKHPRLDAVTQRLALCETLRTLSRSETVQYVQHRCRTAGASACPFDDGAMQALYEIGRGNLRATDHLALRALETAHERDRDTVDGNHVAEARRLLWP
jgi:general secretion pathway protein A